jgi:2-iminobutanoate/2-iminopropanoate deaminase
MSKTIIKTNNSPAAIGPYNQGIVYNGILYTSGQLPIHPVTSEVPAGIQAQTVQVLENLKAIIEAAGSSMDKVLKCTVYIVDFNDFAVMNEIYSAFFPNNPPARATVGISGLAKNALVEIDAVAIV